MPNRLALTTLAIGYAAHGGIDGTTNVLVWDGLLTVLLVVAYLTCRGWRKVDRTPPAAVAELAAQS